MQLNYSPDGKVLLYTTIHKSMYLMRYGKEGDDAKEQWHNNEKDMVKLAFALATELVINYTTTACCFDCYVQSCRRWNYSDASNRTQYTPRRVPKFLCHYLNACSCRRMCSGCFRSSWQVIQQCLTLQNYRVHIHLYIDRYLATGGHDSIVNLFDIADCICVRTITACE